LPDDAEAEHRAAVVPARGIAAEDGVGDDGRFDVQRGETVAPALAVHDDAVEAGEQVTPQSLLRRRPPREEVVRGEDGRLARPQKAIVELGHEPLDVQDVRAAAHEACDAERMLCDLERYAQPRADEEPRGERIERL